MSTDGQGIKCRRNIVENFNRLSRVHEHYRQTIDRQMEGRQHIVNVNASSRSLILNAYWRYRKKHIVYDFCSILQNALVQ